MTSAPPKRDKLNKAIITALGANSLGLKFDLLRIPEGIEQDPDEGFLLKPYGIVYPLESFVSHGDLEEPQRHVKWPYQLTNVGQTPDQAQQCSDYTRTFLLERDGSGFTHAITASDVDVIDRHCSMFGSTDPSGGGLWQVVDRYDLEVTSSAP